MSDACRESRAALGAVAIGKSDETDSIALQAHLDGCPSCRDELRELTSVARALALADANRVSDTPAQPSGALGERVLERVAAQRVQARRRARQRTVTALAAAAVVALLITGAIAWSGSRNGDGTKVVFPASNGVAARAVLRSEPTGTQVAFHVSGLHDGDDYWLWLTGDDGVRIAAGTFRGSAGTVDVTMTAAISLGETRRVWVTDAADAVVLDKRLP